jgi:hypothetical protein
VREVALRFPGADRDLAGTLALPPGAGPFPAAVLVSGSGRVDRDSNAPQLAIDSTRQLAGDIARIGLAKINARWFREYLDDDPRPDLARLDVRCSPSPAARTYRWTRATWP